MRRSEGVGQRRKRERETHTHTHTHTLTHTHKHKDRKLDGGRMEEKQRVVDGWRYRGHNSYQQISSTQLKNDDASLTLSY